jgi:cytochrome c oxidase subunit IV
MSEPHSAKPAAATSAAGHDHPVDFNAYLRRCLFVFIAALCAISLMICVSFLPHIGWPAKVTMILAVAIVNASIVAGFLMHLLSEKKMIYSVLLVTVIFFAGLIGLTVWAINDFPTGTAIH